LYLQDNLLKIIPKNNEKMTTLAKGKLFLSGNPI